MNARRIALAAAAVAVLVGGLVAALVAGGGDEEAAPAADTTSTVPATTTTAPPPTFPLTGLPVTDPALAARPALMVKVDGTTRALDRHAGLTSADLVYVEKVEGGATRLATVFHSRDAVVGPVRSARTTDVDLTANLNRPLYAHSGGAAGVLDIIRAANLVDVGFDERRGAYQSRGSGVLRLFISTAEFFGFAPEGAGPPPPLFPYRPAGEPVAAAGAADSAGVAMAYGGQANTQVSYEAVPEGWARFQDGIPHFDDSGYRVIPANVIVQYTEYRDSGFVDVTGAPSPEAVTVGEGEALVFTGGKVVPARWSRPDAGAATTYSDSAGAPIPLSPGSTWVELAPPGSATTL